ncbi:hypothetical protein Tco_0084554 [Tanacetum coccineum]
MCAKENKLEKACFMLPRSRCAHGMWLLFNYKRLSATDISAHASMKNVAKCDTWCELQNPVNHLVFECKLRPKPFGRGHAAGRAGGGMVSLTDTKSFEWTSTEADGSLSGLVVSGGGKRFGWGNLKIAILGCRIAESREPSSFDTQVAPKPFGLRATSAWRHASSVAPNKSFVGGDIWSPTRAQV